MAAAYGWESRFGEGAVPGGLWDKEMHALAQLQGPSSEGNLDCSPYSIIGSWKTKSERKVCLRQKRNGTLTAASLGSVPTPTFSPLPLQTCIIWLPSW